MHTNSCQTLDHVINITVHVAYLLCKATSVMSWRRLQVLVGPARRSISTTTRRYAERSVNKVQLLGRVGMEPKQHGTEKTMVSFPLATSIHYRSTNDDGSVTENSRTSWHLINVRQPYTQDYVLNHIGKGSRVYISGRLEYGQSKREDGSTKDITIILSDEVILLSASKTNQDREIIDDQQG